MVATPSGALAGSLWVEGAELHYIASAGVEYAGTGTSVSTPSGAVVGSLWQEGENLFYIDASGVKRQVLKMSLGAKSAPAVAGSVWVDDGTTAGKQLQWVSGTTRYEHWNGST